MSGGWNPRRLRRWEPRSILACDVALRDRQCFHVTSVVTLASREVRGRIFVRRLYDLSCKVKHLQKLSVGAILDIKWWMEFALSWNRCSLFTDDLWSSSVHLRLATDASNLGYGGVLGYNWFN